MRLHDLLIVNIWQMSRKFDAGRDIAFDLKDGFMIIPLPQMLSYWLAHFWTFCSLDFREEGSPLGVGCKDVGRPSIVLLRGLNHIM